MYIDICLLITFSGTVISAMNCHSVIIQCTKSHLSIIVYPGRNLWHCLLDWLPVATDTNTLTRVFTNLLIVRILLYQLCSVHARLMCTFNKSTSTSIRDIWDKRVANLHYNCQDMNEPANFGTNEERPWNWPEEYRPYWSLKCPTGNFDDPPYRTSECIFVSMWIHAGSQALGEVCHHLVDVSSW